VCAPPSGSTGSPSSIADAITLMLTAVFGHGAVVQKSFPEQARTIYGYE
jgi:hypothetical protein